MSVAKWLKQGHDHRTIICDAVDGQFAPLGIGGLPECPLFNSCRDIRGVGKIHQGLIDGSTKAHSQCVSGRSEGVGTEKPSKVHSLLYNPWNGGSTQLVVLLFARALKMIGEPSKSRKPATLPTVKVASLRFPGRPFPVTGGQAGHLRAPGMLRDNTGTALSWSAGPGRLLAER